MNTQTPVQAVAEASVSKRQLNSLRTLQRKVDTTSAMYVSISPAQKQAMQTAYTAVKASGLPLDPQLAKYAAELGLK